MALHYLWTAIGSPTKTPVVSSKLPLSIAIRGPSWWWRYPSSSTSIQYRRGFHRFDLFPPVNTTNSVVTKNPQCSMRQTQSKIK